MMADPHTDTWQIWSAACFDVFEPGRSYWECPDAEAAKVRHRAWLATAG